MADPTDPDANLLDDYFGTLSPSWVPDSSTDDSRRIVVIPVTKLYGDSLFGKVRGVRVDQGTGAWLRLVLYADQTGAPLTITIGQYSTAPEVLVRYREASGYNCVVLAPDEEDTPELASDGRSVLLPMPASMRDCAGVYQAQAMVKDSGGVERVRNDFTIMVDRGLFTTDGGAPHDRGPPTVFEVRNALRDHPGANRLLGEYEFDVAEIGNAIASAVQTYNNTAPTGYAARTTVTWPSQWRRALIDGCLSYLFETACVYHRRGHLPYSAGGLAIDDLAKDKDYLQAAEAYRLRYEQWCRQKKMTASIDAGWGSVSSGYPW